MFCGSSKNLTFSEVNLEGKTPWIPSRATPRGKPRGIIAARDIFQLVGNFRAIWHFRHDCSLVKFLYIYAAFLISLA
jgi:hypothetical protein